MPQARPHAILFDWAHAQAAALPTALTIELRLARLETHLTAAGVPAGDPRVPGQISALFPPGALAELPPALQRGRGLTATVAALASPGRPQKRVPGMAKRLRGMIAALALPLALLVSSDAPLPPVIIDTTTELPPPPPSGHWARTQSRLERTNWVYYQRAAGIIGLGLGLWLLLFLRRSRLARERNPDLAPVIALAVTLARSRLFSGPAFEQALRTLKLRRSEPSQRLDIRKSMHASVRQAGFPTIVFGERRVPPEYLVLNERQSAEDHLPEIGRALHARLGEAQIAAKVFDYFGAPYRLGSASPGGGVDYRPIEGVMSRHPGARALLLEEGFDLYADLSDPQLGEALAQHLPPVLLNPREPAQWDAPERAAARSGMGSVYLGGLSGEGVARALARAKTTAAGASAAEESDLPAFLAGEGDLLLAADLPETLDARALIANLADFWLSPAEMLWLRTVALFPVVHIGFTYFSGIALSSLATINVDAMLRLVRLPWFRAGTIPDWLRQELVRGLSQAEFARAKAIVSAFFSPEAAEARSAGEIIQVCDRAATSKWRKRFAQQLARSDLPALRDGLLHGAFAKSDPAEIEIAAVNRRRRRWWLRPEVLAPALTALALSVQYLIDERTFTEVRTSCCVLVQDDTGPADAAPPPTAPIDVPPTQDASGGPAGGSTAADSNSFAWLEGDWVVDQALNGCSEPATVRLTGADKLTLTMDGTTTTDTIRQTTPGVVKTYAFTFTKGNGWVELKVTDGTFELSKCNPRAERTAYIHIANPLDRDAAMNLVDELTLIRFKDGPIIIPGIEYRPNSPSRTEVRCYTAIACANAPKLTEVLRTFGVPAQISDGRKGRYAGARALEVWFADKDLEDGEAVADKNPQRRGGGTSRTAVAASSADNGSQLTVQGPPPTAEPSPALPPDRFANKSDDKGLIARIEQLDDQSDALYDKGDYQGALKLNTEACDLGGIRGCYWNGYLYEAGKGVRRDVGTAIEWYERACRLTSEQACEKASELRPATAN